MRLWRSIKKRLTVTTTLLLVFFLLLCVSALAFSGCFDLGKYYGHNSTETSPKIFQETPQSSLEFPLHCNAWNQTNICPTNYPKTYKPNQDRSSSSNTNNQSSSCPNYFRWIHEDLRHWKETGITKEMIEGGRKHAHFKLVIINGKAYVEKYKPWIQTRGLFTMWGISQLLRMYPGKLPDLELMFDCDDRPVIPAKNYHGGPPPLFRYCSDWRSLDIVFPDWSFWGWAETNIRPWKNVLRDIKEGNNKTKWKDRVPYAYWKGNPHVAPWRKDLLKCNVTDKDDWNTRLYIQDWNEEAKKGYKESNLGDQCTHRYKIYIEGWAWSVSEKYILACNSPTLYLTPRWYDFFMRGMIPQQHYWPIRDNDKCKSLKFAVDYGNNHLEKAEAIGEAGSRFIHEEMKMEYIYDYIFHLLNEYSKLLKFKPKIPSNANEICSENMACPADGNWRKFMEESLVKSPSNSNPCTLPPPYDPQTLKAFNDEKIRSTKEIEKWEDQFWEAQNNKQ